MLYGRLIIPPLLLFISVFASAQWSYSSIPQKSQVAQQPPRQPPASGEPRYRIDDQPIMLVLKSLFFIIVIGLLLYLMLRAYRALTFGHGLGRHSPQIRILSTSAIGPRKSLCLVDTLDHILLLGVTDGQISVLLEIPTAELNEQVKNTLVNLNRRPEPNFKKLLSSLLKK
ncbi:MAG: FliO/MopB family protein [bacterium]